MRSLVSFCLLFVAVPCLSAQTHRDEPQWEKVCAGIKAKPLAAQAPAGPLPGKALESCDETDLYYGLDGSKPDYAAALQCGWWQRAHAQSAEGNMFYGPGVLAMLYANGQAVPRNYDMALRFACEESWASPAEMEGRIGHLEALRDAKSPSSKPFDLCDDTTSGLSMGFCTSIGTRAADAKRSAKVQAVVAALPAASKTSFAPLQTAEAAFEDVRSTYEIDLSGTARAMFSLQEEARLRDQFLINLQRFGKRDLPAATASDVTALDTRLNAVYAQLQQVPASKWQSEGTINFDGIRKTERAWVKLTDAWVVFAKVAYPDLPETRVRAQLIRLRLHQLQSLQP